MTFQADRTNTYLQSNVLHTQCKSLFDFVIFLARQFFLCTDTYQGVFQLDKTNQTIETGLIYEIKQTNIIKEKNRVYASCYTGESLKCKTIQRRWISPLFIVAVRRDKSRCSSFVFRKRYHHFEFGIAIARHE